MQDTFFIDKLLLMHDFNIENVSKYTQINTHLLRERVDTIIRYQKQLKKLLTIPIIEQKTPAWYKARECMISASDFAQGLGEGKFGTQKQLIQKKCEPPNESAFSQSNPFFKWGNMFESVAIEVYSKLNNVNINAFGLLKHPTHDFFGASPDGISNLGIMVEIKCPLKRKIVEGDIPKQYYYQIQGQLEVCGLDECDYFECEFIQEYNKEVFSNMNHEFMGAIVELENGEFLYSSLEFKKDHLMKFINQHHYPRNKIIMWYLKKYNMQRVFHDKEFVKDKLAKLEKVWNSIEFYRLNKEQYVIDILNIVDIPDTELFKPIPKKKLEGYAIQDINE